MLRPVRGVLCIENEQTGDGRVITEGALTWADLPLPLGWLQEEMHGDLLGGATQVGTLDSITRSGAEVAFTGAIDDEQPDGAELVRRLEAGSAPMGSRVGVSVDPDDWELQIVATDQEDDDGEGGILILASASGRGPMTWDNIRQQVLALAASVRPQLVTIMAAAGDPDPGEEGAAVLFEDAADAILQRYTRLRIRGATCCAIPAFAGAYLELDTAAAPADDATPPADDTTPAEDDATTAAASAPARTEPVAPPAAWFATPEPQLGDQGMTDVYGGMPAQELLVEQDDGSLAVPLTIADNRQVFGHVARWGQCHVGYPGACVTPPDSATAYAHFHVGQVLCDDGSRVATGVLTVGCDHAAAELMAPAARDHYAHTGLGWADGRVTSGEFGPWFCGALRPEVTDAQLRLLRASSLSGDWRRIGASLELIAALSVSVPGFPIAREAVTASGLPALAASAVAPRTFLDDGSQTSLVAAGVVQRCPECMRRQSADAAGGGAGRLRAMTPDPRMDEGLAILHKLERRTRHLLPQAVQAAAGRLGLADRLPTA